MPKGLLTIIARSAIGLIICLAGVASAAAKVFGVSVEAFQGALPSAVLISAPFGIAGLGLAWAWQRERRRHHRCIEVLAEQRQIAAEQMQLIDALPLPIWWSRVTHGTAVISGNQKAQQIGQPRIVPRHDRQTDLLPDLFARVAGTGFAHSKTTQVITEGESKLYNVTASPLNITTTTNDDDLCAVGFAIDQSALVAAQNELARHVRSNADVLESLPTAIAIYSADRILRFANTAFARLWRLDAEWLAKEPTFQEVLEALRESRQLPEYVDFPAYKRAQLELFQSLVEKREELLHLPNETTLRRVVMPHSMGGLIFTYEDVSDRLVLERSYNTLIDVQRETLDNLNEGIVVFGMDGRIKLYNPEFVKIWRLSEVELEAGMGRRDLLSHISRFFIDQTAWQLEQNRLEDELSERIYRRGILQRGDGIHLEYTVAPLPDGGMLVTFSDITARERVERALRDSNQALEAADRLKTEFIANVSYELRTPLNTIIGFAEILANQYFGELSARQLEYGRGILESSQRLLSLINDILDLATIEAGYMELNLSEVDLHTMLASVLGLTRERARSQHLALLFDCRPNIGIIQADARRLKQALFNLLTNACKFTPHGGTITLGARREQTGLEFDQIIITVTDTGIGIPEQDQARVFDRFHRGILFGRQSGAGLGLSLVKNFIELHGGRVELVSIQGQGTTVTCSLPVRTKQSEAKPPRLTALKARRPSAFTEPTLDAVSATADSNIRLEETLPISYKRLNGKNGHPSATASQTMVYATRPDDLLPHPENNSDKRGSFIAKIEEPAISSD